jgi:hypothetical protein
MSMISFKPSTAMQPAHCIPTEHNNIERAMESSNHFFCYIDRLPRPSMRLDLRFLRTTIENGSVYFVFGNPENEKLS